MMWSIYIGTARITKVPRQVAVLIGKLELLNREIFRLAFEFVLTHRFAKQILFKEKITPRYETGLHC